MYLKTILYTRLQVKEMYKIIYFKSFIDVTNFVSNHQELIDTTYHTMVHGRIPARKLN